MNGVDSFDGTSYIERQELYKNKDKEELGDIELTGGGAPKVPKVDNVANGQSSSLPGKTEQVGPGSEAQPSKQSQELTAAAHGVKDGTSLSLEKLSGVLNTNDPAIRSQLEALGLTDAQLNNKNTVFAITGEPGDKHLSYNYESKEYGNRSGSVKLDPSKDNFGVDFSKGGLGASGWMNYNDKARNDDLLSGLKGQKYDNEIARRNGYDSSEAFRTAETLKSQLTALSRSGLQDKNAEELLAKLDGTNSEKDIDTIKSEFLAHLKNNESVAAYLAGRRHGAMSESLEVNDKSTDSHKMTVDVAQQVSDNLKSTTSDGDHTGLGEDGLTITDSELINNYEDAMQLMLDKNTEELQKLDEAEQKEFTEAHKKLDESITNLASRTDLSAKQKAIIENLYKSYSSEIGQDGKGSQYLKAEQEYINSLLKTEASKKTESPEASPESDFISAKIDGKDTELQRVRDTAGYYDDVYHDKASDTLYQKQGEEYKAIEKSKDGLYHVDHSEYTEAKEGEEPKLAQKIETLYGDGPLGIKQVVAAYPEGVNPSDPDAKADRYLYNYAHGVQADDEKNVDGNYDVFRNKDGEMIGFKQNSADGVYKPLEDEKTAKATEAENLRQQEEAKSLREQAEAKSLQEEAKAANEARKQELIAKLKSSPNEVTKKDLDELGALTGTRLLKFEATWCGACIQLTNSLNEGKNQPLTDKYSGGSAFQKASFIQGVDYDQNPAMVKDYKVSGIPDSIIIGSNNQVIGRFKDNMPRAEYFNNLANILNALD